MPSRDLTRSAAQPASAATPAARSGRPNLLYIFPDQFRFQSLGLWRQPGFREALHAATDPVVTPNLDRLGRQSVLLSQACSTHPLCSPHRAMLMSGMYPEQNGSVGTNCREDRSIGLRHDLTCFTDVLAEAGYETAWIGKTHWERTEPLFDADLRYVGTTDPPGGHFANGYDTYIPPGRGRHGNRFWFQNVGDRHKDALSYASSPDLVGGLPDGHPHRHRRFTPELEADVVIDFLDPSGGRRDAGRPFSIFWSPNPPHTPYTDVDRDCERAVYEAHYADAPLDELLNRPNVRPTAEEPAERAVRIYFSLVTSIDQQVGRVLAALDESGEADNTVVVFTSDHGEMMGSHGLMAKNEVYDESFLVPFMVRHPGALTPRVDDLLLGTVDVMPTVLGLLGLQERIPGTARGSDHSRGLRTGDHDAAAKPVSALYLGGDKRKGVRTDRHTYLVDAERHPVVFDNHQDPYQTDPLPPEALPAGTLETLQTELGRWLWRADDAWFFARTRADAVRYPTG